MSVLTVVGRLVVSVLTVVLTVVCKLVVDLLCKF